jgi:RNA polymerase sigma factor (sigma-70 family)
MGRDSAIPRESFEEILAWLNADREMAGVLYVQLRQDLTKLFAWNGCADPEGLTDEVFDRVARKVHDLRQTYEGDPRPYFYAVAKNLIKENLRRIKTHVSLGDVDLSQQHVTEDQDKEKLETVLKECIDELPPTERHIILSYYKAEKREGRRTLAADLAISEMTLRVRVHRIRQSLLRNLERKMETT